MAITSDSEIIGQSFEELAVLSQNVLKAVCQLNPFDRCVLKLLEGFQNVLQDGFWYVVQRLLNL